MNIHRSAALQSGAAGTNEAQANSDSAARVELLCPSSQYTITGAKVFAVVAGTADKPEVAYLNVALPVSDEILELAAPVGATEVFRFAAPCQTYCAHNRNGTCQLVDKVARLVPEASEKLPRCAIRNECKWWHQEGADGCRRCSVMATSDPNQAEPLSRASAPDLTQ